MTIYYLYVKTHNITGLKYLGYTKRKDPHKYKGSGKHWTNHINKHGYDVTTEILKECSAKDEIKEWGLYYSKLWNIVEEKDENGNKTWANLKEECGDGGAIYGESNGMYRKTHTDKVKQDSAERAIKTFKGKSYEQLYGEEKASSLRNSRSEHMRSYIAVNLDKRLGSGNPNAKSYEFSSPTGDIFTTTGNLKKFCKENGLRCDSIINVLKGREADHRGWSARYI